MSSKKLTACRVCKSQKLHKFLDLGSTALANSFVKKEELGKPELKFPLEVCFCENCNFVQLTNIVDPKLMFQSYLWVSGTSDAVPVHFRELAKDAAQRAKLTSSDLVIDIGSNDGTLLKAFKEIGATVLGIEPAKNIAAIANGKGIDTINEFFNSKTAESIAKIKGQAKVITATNVFAHIDDLYDTIKGVKALLRDDGIFIIEAPYLIDLLEKGEFDTIYHEHLSYLSVRPLIKLFELNDMVLFDVKRTAIHGGSIRFFVSKDKAIKPSKSLEGLVELEKKMKLDSLKTYKIFADRANNLKKETVSLLQNLKSKGKRIAGYGAPAKGNTLLQFYGIDTKLLDYISDKNPLKHGLYTPGSHIPVYSAEKLIEDMPDYVFILAWNFADEVMRQQSGYSKLGGKFIVPIPKPIII